MASNNEEGTTRRSGKQSGRLQDGSAQKPKRKPRDRTKDNQAENTPPSTPLKPTKSTDANRPATEGKQTKSHKKKINPNAQETVPQVGMNPTLPTTTVTPAKPVQIYAGPTFHASPAPSSLPIPKMFSKSMPQVNDKDASLRSMLQGEASGEESSEVEGSPSGRRALPPQARGVREESPLDIFFRADKEEKARRQANASQSSLVTPPNQRRAQSTSPGPDSVGSVSRPSNDGSMFPLEMDHTQRTPSSRLEDSPSMPGSLQDRRTADAQAKTEALKNLLRFQGGPAQRPASATNSLNSSRASSTPPAPAPFERSASEQQVSTTSFPKQSYPSPPKNQPPAQRPNTRHTSQLRQQLDQVANEHYASSNSSPRVLPVDDPNATHLRQQGPYPPPPPSNRMPSSSHRASPGPPTFGPQDALRASLGQQAPANAPSSAQSGPTSNEAMEEQLRRILKLDSLPNAGVHT